MLARIGNIFLKEENEGDAFTTTRRLPVLPGQHERHLVARACFVKNEMYEKAVAYFERAAQIQPQEVKWKLMVASATAAGRLPARLRDIPDDPRRLPRQH